MRVLHNDAVVFSSVSHRLPVATARCDISDDPLLYERTLIVHFDLEPYDVGIVNQITLMATSFQHLMYFTPQKTLAKWYCRGGVNPKDHPHTILAAKSHLEE